MVWRILAIFAQFSRRFLFCFWPRFGKRTHLLLWKSRFARFSWAPLEIDDFSSWAFKRLHFCICHLSFYSRWLCTTCLQHKAISKLELECLFSWIVGKDPLHLFPGFWLKMWKHRTQCHMNTPTKKASRSMEDFFPSKKWSLYHCWLCFHLRGSVARDWATE